MMLQSSGWQLSLSAISYDEIDRMQILATFDFLQGTILKIERLIDGTNSGRDHKAWKMVSQYRFAWSEDSSGPFPW
jgi:hypothetical protein